MTEKDTMQVKPEKKEDRRVRRTKKLLTHGLIQLMKEKQVQDITVRELADLVDVNRGTFYLYYRDIFDMLDSIEQELFNQVNQLIAAHKGETVLTHTLPVLKELFHLVEENKELCQVLLGQNGDMKFLKKLSDVVQEAFRREWLMMKKGRSITVMRSVRWALWVCCGRGWSATAWRKPTTWQSSATA